MKPILKYSGGKSRDLKYIIPYLPEYTGRYVEPFFGGGAMYFYLEPKSAWINDIDGKLMHFYDEVSNNFQLTKKMVDVMEIAYAQNHAKFEDMKNHPEKYEILKSTEPVWVEDKNEALYYACRDSINGLYDKSLSWAADYYFVNKTAFSGMSRYNAKGEFNVPFGRYKKFSGSSLTEKHSNLLSTALITSLSYENVFENVGKDDFLFLDPPYTTKFSDYASGKNSFGEHEHRILASEFKKLDAKTLMVMNDSPLSRELYDGYIVGQYDKTYSHNIKNRVHSSSNVLIITNY